MPVPVVFVETPDISELSRCGLCPQGGYYSISLLRNTMDLRGVRTG